MCCCQLKYDKITLQYKQWYCKKNFSCICHQMMLWMMISFSSWSQKWHIVCYLWPFVWPHADMFGRWISSIIMKICVNWVNYFHFIAILIMCDTKIPHNTVALDRIILVWDKIEIKQNWLEATNIVMSLPALISSTQYNHVCCECMSQFP